MTANSADKTLIFSRQLQSCHVQLSIDSAYAGVLFIEATSCGACLATTMDTYSTELVKDVIVKGILTAKIAITRAAILERDLLLEGGKYVH